MNYLEIRHSENASDIHFELTHRSFCYRYTTLSYRAPEMVNLYSGKLITTKADIWVCIKTA